MLAEGSHLGLEPDQDRDLALNLGPDDDEDGESYDYENFFIQGYNTNFTSRCFRVEIAPEECLKYA